MPMGQQILVYLYEILGKINVGIARSLCNMIYPNDGCTKHVSLKVDELQKIQNFHVLASAKKNDEDS